MLQFFQEAIAPFNIEEDQQQTPSEVRVHERINVAFYSTSRLLILRGIKDQAFAYLNMNVNCQLVFWHQTALTVFIVPLCYAELDIAYGGPLTHLPSPKSQAQ